ncbi:uncharacterized protein LOC143740605 [Siphateles boraxobius]|uniref:uncharacterized protein LOC143740605 n=1 Tax=Siphateles boraxobius TaxID=180520 RepID=UPI004062A426
MALSSVQVKRASKASTVHSSLAEGSGRSSAQVSSDKISEEDKCSDNSFIWVCTTNSSSAQIYKSKEQFAVVNSRLLSMEDRLAALESKNCVEESTSRKRRRVHNPKIAEAVRRLHNSETNCRRYEPEQGLTSPHNEAVTSYLLGAMSASPDLHDADNDDIVSACKTYYETVRRSFRYKQPDLASQAEAMKSSARSHARRKRCIAQY